MSLVTPDKDPEPSEEALSQGEGGARFPLLCALRQDILSANLVVEHIEAESGLRLRLAIELPLKAPDLYQALQGSSPIALTSPSSKAHQKSGPFAPPALPGIITHTT